MEGGIPGVLGQQPGGESQPRGWGWEIHPGGRACGRGPERGWHLEEQTPEEGP